MAVPQLSNCWGPPMRLRDAPCRRTDTALLRAAITASSATPRVRCRCRGGGSKVRRPASRTAAATSSSPTPSRPRRRSSAAGAGRARRRLRRPSEGREPPAGRRAARRGRPPRPDQGAGRDSLQKLERQTAIRERLIEAAHLRDREVGIARAVHELTGLPVMAETEPGNLLAAAGPVPDGSARSTPRHRDELLDRARRAGQPVRDQGRLSRSPSRASAWSACSRWSTRKSAPGRRTSSRWSRAR